jgi:putative FmdB family regulatory protein
MPLYEYLCKECSTVFEILVRNKKERILCPKCGSASTSKLFSTFAYRGSTASADGAPQGAGSGCSTCSGGSCATCH